MGKRYYVEVTGLGEDGAEELHKAGVSRESILVVDDKDLLPIEQAIKDAMNVTMDEMRSDKRLPEIVAARIIYVHYRVMEGHSISTIAKEINRVKRYTRYYREIYADRIFGDREFKAADSRVKALLDANPMWSAAEVQKPTTGKKKWKKRKMKKKKKIRPPQEVIDREIERRQLKIEFEQTTIKNTPSHDQEKEI